MKERTCTISKYQGIWGLKSRDGPLSGPWEIQQVITSVQRADIPDERLCDGRPTWKGCGVTGCAYQLFLSGIFLMCNFISSLRIALYVFPLLVCLSYENIPFTGQICLRVIRKMTFHLAIYLWYIEYTLVHAS